MSKGGKNRHSAEPARRGGIAASGRAERVLVAAALCVLLIAAVGLRFHGLEHVPPGFTYDEALNANNALETLRTGRYRIYYRDYCDIYGRTIMPDGREGLMVWVISFLFFLSLAFRDSGLSIALARAAPALFGAFSALGLYLLGSELLRCLRLPGRQARAAALAAAFFLTVSFWHLLVSRICVRVTPESFMLVFSLFFFLRALRRESVADALAGGVLFGLGFYTYIPFRVAPLLLPFIMVPWLLDYRARGRGRRFALQAAAGGLVAFVVALPMLLFIASKPDLALERVSSFYGMDHGVPVFGSPLRSFLGHLAMFSFSGDPSWQSNISGMPMLPLPLSILLAVGVAVLAGRIRGAARTGDRPALAAGLLLAAWPLLLIMPSVVAGEQINYATRTASVMPAIYLVAALGAWRLWPPAVARLGCPTALALLVLVAAALSFHEPYRYFRVWAAHPETGRAYERELVEKARYLKRLPADRNRVVVWDKFSLLQVVIFIDRTGSRPRAPGDGETYYLWEGSLEAFDWGNIAAANRETVFLPLSNGAILERLRAADPRGMVARDGDITVFTVPPFRAPAGEGR